MLRFAEPHIYTPVDDSLVLWISGRGRGVGSKVFDLSGKGNHGTIYGATWKNTPLGHSVLSFDGVDDWIDCGNDESLNASYGVTFEVWAKIAFVTSGVWFHILLSKHEDFRFGLYATYEGYPEEVSFVIEIGGNYYIVHSGKGYFDSWHHFIGTYDCREMRLYADGELKGSKSISGTLPVNTEHVKIGGGVVYRYTKAIIGDSRMYNRALTAWESRERFNATKHLYGY